MPNVDFADWDSRSRTLIGNDGVEALAAARVFVVGIGGVGGYALEMLARSGVGHLSFIDADAVSISNINRQIVALRSTVGLPKTELFATRIRDINPEAELAPMTEFLTPENVREIVGRDFDFVIDAIDTVAPKVALLEHCLRNGIPVASSMGAGGRTDASKVVLTDIWQTRDDGLAKAVRTRLKKDGIRKRLTVATSLEPPAKKSIINVGERNKMTSLGTLAMVPATFGILLASAAVRHILSKCGSN